MSRILLTAVVIVAVMALIKDGRILRQAGLTGGCSLVATPHGETGAWERCLPGKLEGAPNLSRNGCTSAGTAGKAEYWRCPAPIDSGSF